MDHTITYNSEKHIIETKVQGDLTEREADVLISEMAQLAMEKNCFLFITDYREATLNLSTIALHRVPQKVEEEARLMGIHPSKFKRAIVVSSHLKDFRFFETVTLNSGQNIKMFQDMNEALQWLCDNIPQDTL